MHLKQHYENLFKKYGDSPQAVQWSDQETQIKRFEQLISIGNLQDCSVLDFGCGLGHMLEFIEGKGIEINYTGVDIVESMLECAQKKFPEQRFCQFEDIKDEQFDYIFISGVFNNKLDDNRCNYKKILASCYNMTRIGLAFNMMSKYVDYYDDNLYYEDPAYVFTYVKKHIAPYVTLKNDYCLKKGVPPFEFAVHVYKQGKI